jgi:hypothetical protein
MSFKFQNILNPAVHYTQGGLTTERFSKGRVLSLGLSHSFH